MSRLDARVTANEHRVDGAVTYRALVRYDAYGEMSGRQSTSIALLDARRSGIVLSSIHHRESRAPVRQADPRGPLRSRALARGGGGRRARACAAVQSAAGPQLRRRWPVRVAYLGPEGTFSHEALLSAPGASAREPVPFATIVDAVMAVHDGAVEHALVPIENSLEGSVSATLDVLAMDARGRPDHRRDRLADPAVPDRADSARARRDRDRRLPPAGERAMRALHPHAPRQANVISASSTADAVRIVAEETMRPWAALGNRVAAELYGCEVLRVGVRGRPGQRDPLRLARTRRARRRASRAPANRADPGRPPIVFWGVGSESPGWLVSCLSEFADRDVNLTRIESRPRKQGLGRYMFFADLEGRAGEVSVDEALAGPAPSRRGSARSRVVPGRLSATVRRVQCAVRWTVRYQRHCGPRRALSTSGVGLKLGGCSSSTRPTNRSMSARFAGRSCSC